MSKICTHVNENTCRRCKPRPEKCWQLAYEVKVNSRIIYYLKEFYTGKIKKIPKKYFPQIDKLLEDKIKYNTKLCNCEMAIQKVIEKVLRRRNK